MVKAAMKLYNAERQKADGMSARQVKSVIENEYIGVSPSHATIHYYVANLGLISMPPVKSGPWGTIPPLDYMALCAAFASYMRIQQVNNCEGTNKQGKIAPIVAKTMSIDVKLVGELLRRIAWDTAINMS